VDGGCFRKPASLARGQSLDSSVLQCDSHNPEQVPAPISLDGVSPGTVLDGRYRIDQVVPSAGAHRAHLGTVLETNQRVMLIELPDTNASLLTRALRVSHPNLTTLIELLPTDGEDSLGVVEYPEGTTLKELLENTGRLEKREAVAYVVCVADALGALHQRGAAHGLVRPASVVLNAAVRGGAILAYAPAVPPPNPYRNPERGLGAPSPADDVWALGALLHHTLVGKPPPPFGVRSPRDLDGEIDEPALAEVVANCLAPKPAHRVTIVTAARAALASWLRGEARARAGPGAVPAPTLPPPVVRVSPEPTGPQATAALEGGTADGARTGRGPAPIAVGIAAVLVAAAVATAIVIVRRSPSTSPEASLAPAPSLVEAPASAEALRSARPEVDEPPPVAAASAAVPAPSNSAVAAQATVAREESLSGGQLAECVIRLLPPESFGRSPDFDWLCQTKDPRRGHSKMRRTLVKYAGSKGLTPAMRLWSRLRWYGMAGFAVIRASCCPNAEPLKLPKVAGCEPLEGILDELGVAVALGNDHLEVLGRYTKNVKCNTQLGRAYIFRQKDRIRGGERSAFLSLLKLRPHD
jgi:hypothetical protein